MTEIRPIVESEAEAFLEVLCDVFELESTRAHAIFFTEPLFDLNRKWALIDSGTIVSILTTVPLEFGWGRAVGIAGVATALDRQGEGLAASLLAKVASESEKRGEGGVLLFAKDMRLYERVGFQPIGHVIKGPIKAGPEPDIPLGLDFSQIERLYTQWAASDPCRLRRDAVRWKYWKWNLRVCTPLGDGYLCFEGGIVREVVTSRPVRDWTLPSETEWFGLASMSEQIGVELETASVELQLMGLNFPGIPQFFMTDQF